ncbi:MAG: hypothetical protein FJ146_06315 [Deltaproteobacteria bacterium]|nr:hypothetical protein [Deltaproteobacteria bacterium]
MKKNENKNQVDSRAGEQQLLNMQRRAFLRNAMLGGLGYGAYSFLKHQGIGHVGNFVRDSLNHAGMTPFNAIDVINDALRGGPSLLTLSQAMAAGNDKPAVFHVFYATSHDIRNELYLMDYGAQYNQFGAGSVSAGANPMNLAGAMATKAPAPLDRLNKWAFDILTTGKINGTTAIAPDAANAPALDAGKIAKISLLAGVGMPGSQGVHRNAVIPGVGNLEYVVQQAFANYSPVGAVVLGTSGFDGAGAVQIPGRRVAQFVNSIEIPGNYMPREKASNPVEIFDDLTGSATVKAVRGQMLDAYEKLKAQVASLRQFSTMADATFGTYGQRRIEGLAGMRMFANLFQAGLANLGSVGMNSFDFHATDAMRAPNGATGNMLTETAQALAGVYYIAQSAFAAEKDAIVHLSTCSNRSQDWVNDNQHVSTLTFIIKGSGDASPFAKVPQQTLLIADNARNMYAEGPGQAPTFTGEAAQQLGVGPMGRVGSIEAGIVDAVGKAIGQTPAVTLASPAAKII